MRAILVSVDYADLLRLTLPYNRHHFEEVMVVTNLSDKESARIAEENGARVFATDSFYEQGADFNKWRALEQGLDEFGRHGWLVIMDADVAWPKKIPDIDWEVGKLYSPLSYLLTTSVVEIPPEDKWVKLRKRSNPAEWAGYTQIFHATDPRLPEPPWHDTNWKHAGGADSFFQFKWPSGSKIRPDFTVLHLGATGRNWCGRVTNYSDGTRPEAADARKLQLRNYMRQRREKIRGTRKWAGDTFSHEKIDSTDPKDA